MQPRGFAPRIALPARWGRSSRTAGAPRFAAGRWRCTATAAPSRAEAATGFASLYDIALPALAEARLLTANGEARRVHALMSLIVGVGDTNLLYRGGTEGLAFAESHARAFLASGSVAIPDWRARAVAMHQAFTARRLSPGGCADLLAMALFVEARGA